MVIMETILTARHMVTNNKLAFTAPTLDGIPALTFPQIAANIINTLLFIVGALAVIFIIVGGIQYVISSGDPKRIDTAKNTITYAVVGLVVSILAFAIVSFVKGQLIK